MVPLKLICLSIDLFYSLLANPESLICMKMVPFVLSSSHINKTMSLPFKKENSHDLCCI